MQPVLGQLGASSALPWRYPPPRPGDRYWGRPASAVHGAFLARKLRCWAWPAAPCTMISSKSLTFQSGGLRSKSTRRRRGKALPLDVRGVGRVTLALFISDTASAAEAT